MPIQLSANVHIEMAVPDVRRAYRFLHDAFGAEKIEQDIVARISYPDFIEIEHVGLGEVVLQFCRPTPREKWPAGFGASVLSADIPHAGYLAACGPCVSNLNFCVRDIQVAKDLLASEGVLPAMSIPMSTPGKERPPGYYFVAMDKLGFDLEFTQGPMVPGGGQAALFPAFTHPRPKTSERVGRLRRLCVAVDHLEATLALLGRLFGVAAAVVPGQGLRFADVRLGNLPVRYWEPFGADGALWGRRGPNGGSHLVFGVERLEATIAAMGTSSRMLACGSWGQAAVPPEDAGRPPLAPRTYRLPARPVLGFDIELEEAPASRL